MCSCKPFRDRCAELAGENERLRDAVDLLRFERAHEAPAWELNRAQNRALKTNNTALLSFIDAWASVSPPPRGQLQERFLTLPRSCIGFAPGE
jgi:hypothetical protein